MFRVLNNLNIAHYLPYLIILLYVIRQLCRFSRNSGNFAIAAILVYITFTAGLPLA